MSCKKYFSNSLKIVASLLSFAYIPVCFSQQTNFFVAAHQDDWQLFMNPNAYNSVKNSSNKTVFIHLTAGDGGLGSGSRGAAKPYYLARREGALRAIRFMVNTDRVGLGTDIASENVTVNGHTIRRYQYNNTIAYFLALPDGGSYGAGASGTSFQSLKLLYDGDINQLDAVDQSASYFGWNDLVLTLDTIVNNEANDTNLITFDLAESDTSINRGSHSDHRHGSLLMQDVATFNSCINLNLYQDYITRSKDTNVTEGDLIVQAGTWGATTSEISDHGYSSSWNHNHNTFLGRQYYRTVTGDCSDISLQNIAAGATVTASSQNVSTDQLASNVIDGIVDGWPGDYKKEWASNREGEGAWLNLSWDREVTVSTIKLYDRPNLADHIVAANLVMSDGTVISVPSLKNDGGPTVITLPQAKVTTGLKLEILTVGDRTANIGLSEIVVLSEQ